MEMTATPPGLRAAILALPLALAAAACAPVGPVPTATLPPDAVTGAGDPTRAAIIGTASAFSSPDRLAGRPAEAARAVANYEYLAVELPTGPRWRGFTGTLEGQLLEGRAELRQALGIAPDAPPQAVIDSLYAASRALSAGDQAAAERLLSPPTYQGGGAATLQRLAALPPMPRVNVAAAGAAGELHRMDTQGQFRSQGADSPGGAGYR